MEYRVIFTAAAMEEARAAAAYIALAGSRRAAEDWLEGIVEAVRSLGTLPHRHGLARESSRHPDAELRQVIYKSHRVIYTVQENAVYVLHIRHAARQDLDQD